MSRMLSRGVTTMGYMPVTERERLIVDHLWIVRDVVRRMKAHGPINGDRSDDDLVQVGSVGLVKAANRFDPSRGVLFTTFAKRMIEGEIAHHLRDYRPIAVPRLLFGKADYRIVSMQGRVRFGSDGGTVERQETLADPRDVYERADLNMDAARAISKLTSDELACVIRVYLIEGQGLGAQRASKTHERALAKMRESLAA